MKRGWMKSGLAVALALGIGGGLAGCQKAPETGRSQLILLPASQADQMGRQAFQQILTKTPVAPNPALNARVQRVGTRLVTAIGLPRSQWDFRLLQDGTPNAFALPGGKVGVNIGLFKVAQNDDQLAAVLGHEIAHVMAKHPAERISRQLLVEQGLNLGGAALGTNPRVVQLAANAATLGLILPFSREQEAEADEIGLQYMARAGYDPRAAIALWQNFARLGGDRTPQFLSTHPSPGNRIARLQSLLPKALPIYERSRR